MHVTVSNLKIGQTVFARECSADRRYCRKGTVIWLHPQKRFVTLLLDGGYRECFFPSDLSPNNRWTGTKGEHIRLPVFSRLADFE